VSLPAPLSFYLCYLVWLAIFASGVKRVGLWKRLPVIALIAGALLITVKDITPFLYLRGVFGDFSITHTLLALAALFNLATANDSVARPLIAVTVKQKLFLCLLLLPTAALFYPSALGAMDFDAYRLGYNSQGFLAALAAITLLSWLLRQYLAAFVIAASVLAWSQHLLESTNLWDYLFDPLLVLYCTAWCLVMATLRLTRTDSSS